MILQLIRTPPKRFILLLIYEIQTFILLTHVHKVGMGGGAELTPSTATPTPHTDTGSDACVS